MPVLHGAMEVVELLQVGRKTKTGSGSNTQQDIFLCTMLALSGNRQPILQVHDGRVALLPPRGPRVRRPTGEEGPAVGPVRGGRDGPQNNRERALRRR